MKVILSILTLFLLSSKCKDQGEVGRVRDVFNSLDSIRHHHFASRVRDLDSIEIEYIKLIDNVIENLCDTLLSEPNHLNDNKFLYTLFGMSAVLNNQVYYSFDHKLNKITKYNSSLSYKDQYIINNENDFLLLYTKASPLSVIVYMSYWELELIDAYSNGK